MHNYVYCKDIAGTLGYLFRYDFNTTNICMHPPLAARNVFLRTYLHESINNSQAQLHTHVSVPSLISRRLSSSFGLQAILNNSQAATIITRVMRAFT